MVLLQTINAALHREPVSFIVYGIYWSCFIVFWTPIAVVFLCIQIICNLLSWYISIGNNAPIYDPKKKPEYNMAIIITGCDTGFGKDLAIQAANVGYTVFAGCLHYKSSIEQYKTFTNIVTIPLDVTKDEDVTNAARTVSDWLHDKNIPMQDIGRQRILHAVINNAGIGIFGNVDHLDLKEFQLLMDVNYFGILRMVKAFLPILKDQAVDSNKTYNYNGMRIINVTSLTGLWVGSPGMAGYGASKSAPQALTTSLRLELRKFNISVGSVNPSFHATPMQLFHDQLMKLWERQPDHILEQYGQPFFDKTVATVETLIKTFLWNADIVSEQILQRCLNSKCPPCELVIGTDSRYLHMIFRMIPPSIWEPIVNTVIRRPNPQCMMRLEKQKQVKSES